MTERPSPTSKRILLVDDEEHIVAATKDYLSGLGFDVDSAHELEEAQALLATGTYGLVIADLRLTSAHGREGLELVSYLHERAPHTRVIVLTAYSSPEVETEVRRRGADVVLSKPQPLVQVAQTASKLLELAS
jgi:CheY-like chemotaxis protein